MKLKNLIELLIDRNSTFRFGFELSKDTVNAIYVFLDLTKCH